VFLRGQDVGLIALEGVLDLFQRLAGMLDVDFVEPPFRFRISWACSMISVA
jgi:hypothetical protein